MRANLVIESLIQRLEQPFRVGGTCAHARTCERGRTQRVEVPTLPRSKPVIFTKRVGCGKPAASTSMYGSKDSNDVQKGLSGSNRRPQFAMWRTTCAQFSPPPAWQPPRRARRLNRAARPPVEFPSPWEDATP